MKKRILALALVLVMCVGITAPALAANGFTIVNGVLTEYTGPGGDVVIPNSVTAIGFLAFRDCDTITSITIPKSVTTINQGAFTGCSRLTSITIPATVTELGAFLFYRCSNLTDIIVDPANSNYADVDGVLFTKDLECLLEYPSGRSGVYCIPDGATRIRTSAFRGSSSITGVVIPNGVTTIETTTFEDCTSLASVILPNGLTEIGHIAFGGCTSLTDISLPSSVVELGNAPFEGCTNLVRITVDSANNSFTDLDGVLYSKDLKKLIAYPGGKGPSYTIPDSATAIGGYAFSKCTAIKEVHIPKSVNSYGESPFAGCANLTQITVDPSSWSFTSVDGVLYTKDMKELVAYPGGKNPSYSIISGVNKIRSFAFSHNPDLTNVIIPSGVASIGQFAFDQCTNLADITIPASVTKIDSYVFQGCKSLSNIYYTGTKSEWDKIDISYGNRTLSDVTINYNSPEPTITASLISVDFADVSPDAYYAVPVAWAVEKEITSGTSDTTFSPNQDCTNAQILTFLWRACGKPAPEIDNPFTNSIPDAYMQAAVWAYEQGMVSGSTFDTNQPCTRAMAVTYLWQAAGSPAVEEKGIFADVPAGADYAQAVAWAVDNGVTSGTSNSTFSPDNVCSRGQIVTFLYRAMEEN